MERWHIYNAEFYGTFAAHIHLDRRAAGARFAREARGMGLVAGSHDRSAFYVLAMRAYNDACKGAA